MAAEPVLKTSLGSEEIIEIVERLQSLEKLLARIKIGILIDNEAIEDEAVYDIVYSKVRVVQCLKLLGAKEIPTKQNFRR